MRSVRALTGYIAILALFTLLFTGCGSGTAQSANGRATFSITWPRSVSRVLPTNTQLIVITITLASNGKQVGYAKILNPATSATIGNLPIGPTLIATLQAFADTTGTSTPIAEVSTSFTVNATAATPVPVSLHSTVTKITITPAQLNLQSGNTATLIAAPFDQQDNLVPVAPGDLTWNSDNPSVAAVDAHTGVVTALQNGAANIIVMEATAKITASIPVVVGITITLKPAIVDLTINQTQQFKATVAGTTNPLVTWSVQEGAAGGTIDSTGLYTPPPMAGTYHVIATSQANKAVTAVAAVTVHTSSAQITLQ